MRTQFDPSPWRKGKSCHLMVYFKQKYEGAALKKHPHHPGCKSVWFPGCCDPQSSGRFVTLTEQQTECRQVRACWQTPGAAMTGGGSDVFLFILFFLAACGRRLNLSNSQTVKYTCEPVCQRSGLRNEDTVCCSRSCATSSWKVQKTNYTKWRTMLACCLFSITLSVCVREHLCSLWKCLKGKHTQTSHQHVISENIGVAATYLAPNLHQAMLSNYTAGARPFQLVNTDQTPTRFAFSLKTYLGLDAVCKGPTFVIDGNCVVLTSSGLNQRALRLLPRYAQEIGEFSAVKMCMSSLIKRWKPCLRVSQQCSAPSRAFNYCASQCLNNTGWAKGSSAVGDFVIVMRSLCCWANIHSC